MNVQWLMAASISEVNIQASSQTSRQLSKDRYLKKQWQKFLSVVLKDEEKVEDKLEDLLHTLNAGQPRLIDQEITGSAQFRNAEKSKLNPPKRKPNEMELKKMFSITLVWIVKYVMENLLDTFGWKNLIQRDGAPIGDDISQAISRHIGNEYDEFLKKS